MTRMRSALRARLSGDREAGFTMAELVVAMFVIGLVLMLLVTIQVSALVSTAEARKRQQATTYANEAMEQLRAIPWNVLRRGMHSSYLTASGGDPYVSGGNLQVDGENLALQIATDVPQDLGQPWAPLFDEDGSHTHVRQDPSLSGTDFTVRTYVLQNGLDGEYDGGAEPPRGLAVIVEWTKSDGTTAHTTAWSTAHPGQGCGNLDTRPFLSACQAMLDSSSATGTVVSTLTATTIADEDTPAVALPLLGPGYGSFYSLVMRTASAGATSTSQQVTIVDGLLQYGGTTVDDDPTNTGTQPGASTATQDWTRGYALYELRASNDLTPNGFPINPADLSVNQGGSAENQRSLSASQSPITLQAVSDYRRPGTADASGSLSCLSGVPGSQPCARAELTNSDQLEGGSGYVIMNVGSTIFRLSRRLNNIEGSGSNTENAWTARFTSAPGTSAAVGCQTLVESGCVSAGATRTIADLSIGTVVGGSWNGNASSGLVLIRGRSSGSSPTCSSGFTQSVLVQRGAHSTQIGADPTITRCGQVRYWNGSGYTDLNVTASTDTTVTTGTVTWSDGDVTVSAVATIQVTPTSFEEFAPDATCVDEACVVNAHAGSLSVSAVYTISRASEPQVEYQLTSFTVLNPPEAMASYKAAPSD